MTEEKTWFSHREKKWEVKDWKFECTDKEEISGLRDVFARYNSIK